MEEREDIVYKTTAVYQELINTEQERVEKEFKEQFEPISKLVIKHLEKEMERLSSIDSLSLNEKDFTIREQLKINGELKKKYESLLKLITGEGR